MRPLEGERRGPLEPDVAAAAAEDLSAEGETDPRAAELARIDSEDLGGLVVGNARAVVGDADGAAGTRAHLDRGGARLERVCDQVAQNCFQQRLRQRDGRQVANPDLGPGPRDLVVELVEDAPDGEGGVGLLALFAARKLEQAFDEPLNRPGAL
jgi:hypothetical protein